MISWCIHVVQSLKRAVGPGGGARTPVSRCPLLVPPRCGRRLGRRDGSLGTGAPAESGRGPGDPAAWPGAPWDQEDLAGSELQFAPLQSGPHGWCWGLRNRAPGRCSVLSPAREEASGSTAAVPSLGWGRRASVSWRSAHTSPWLCWAGQHPRGLTPGRRGPLRGVLVWGSGHPLLAGATLGPQATRNPSCGPEVELFRTVMSAQGERSRLGA